MNILQGTITSIKKVDSFISVGIEVNGKGFNSIILDSSSTDWLRVGVKANIIFKEAEVMIGSKNSQVSARNAHVSKITEIEMGRLFANIIFDFDGHEISSIISKNSCIKLECEVGKEFLWFVKVNEMTLQELSDGE